MNMSKISPSGGLMPVAPTSTIFLKWCGHKEAMVAASQPPKEKPDHVGLPDPQLIEGLEIPAGHVPHGHDPVEARGLAVAGVGGDYDLKVL